MPVAKKKQYVLLAGGANVEGIDYRFNPEKETIVRSTLPLDELFVNKFRLKTDSPAQAEGPVDPFADFFGPVENLQRPTDPEPIDNQPDKTPETPDKTPDKTPKAVKPSTGRVDVSDKFPAAVKKDLKVFKQDRKYIVVRFDEPDEPINPGSGYVTPGQVSKFIESFKE